jgi:hypothetical protein
MFPFECKRHLFSLEIFLLLLGHQGPRGGPGGRASRRFTAWFPALVAAANPRQVVSSSSGASRLPSLPLL